MEKLLCATMLFAVCCLYSYISGTPIFAKEFVHIKFYVPANGHQHRLIIGPKPPTGFVTLHKVTHHHHYHKRRNPFESKQPILQHNFGGNADDFLEEIVLSEAKTPMKSVDDHLSYDESDTELDFDVHDTYYSHYKQQYDEEQKPAMAAEYRQLQGHFDPALDTSFDNNQRPWHHADNFPQSQMPVYPQAANFDQSVGFQFDTIDLSVEEKPMILNRAVNAKVENNIFDNINSSNNNILTPFSNEVLYHCNMPYPSDDTVPAKTISANNEETHDHEENSDLINTLNIHDYDEQTTYQPETKSTKSFKIRNTRFKTHNLGIGQIYNNENIAEKTEKTYHNHKNFQDMEIFRVPSRRNKIKLGYEHISAASSSNNYMSRHAQGVENGVQLFRLT